MAQLNATPPNLPRAGVQYSPEYQEQLNNVLRLFFARLVSPGPVGATALNFDIARLPTQADLANLRSGDVFYSTVDGVETDSGGTVISYALRIKP